MVDPTAVTGERWTDIADIGGDLWIGRWPQAVGAKIANPLYRVTERQPLRATTTSRRRLTEWGVEVEEVQNPEGAGALTGVAALDPAGWAIVLAGSTEVRYYRWDHGWLIYRPSPGPGAGSEEGYRTVTLMQLQVWRYSAGWEIAATRNLEQDWISPDNARALRFLLIGDEVFLTNEADCHYALRGSAIVPLVKAADQPAALRDYLGAAAAAALGLHAPPTKQNAIARWEGAWRGVTPPLPYLFSWDGQAALRLPALDQDFVATTVMAEAAGLHVFGYINDAGAVRNVWYQLGAGRLSWRTDFEMRPMAGHPGGSGAWMIGYDPEQDRDYPAMARVYSLSGQRIALFEIRMMAGTGAGEHRAKLRSLNMSALSDVSHEQPAVIRIDELRQYAISYDMPQAGEDVLYIVDDDARAASAVRLTTGASLDDEGLLRALIRVDGEDAEVDDWGTYVALPFGEDVELENPGCFIRVAVIKPAEMDWPSFGMQPRRESA
jgi:hypothetical protein